jgi:putative ABC transport system permease protein
MKTLDIMKRAGRNLRQAKGRTILTSLAIAIGAFTLTLSLAIGEGARQYADELLKSNIDPQTVFVVKDESLVGGGGGAPGLSSNLREYGSSTTQFGGATFKALNADDIKTIQNAPGVESVTPTYLVNAQYLQVEGVDKKFTTDITVYDSTVKAEAAAGSLPDLGQQIADDEIVMPEAFVEVLKPGAKASDFVGKTITLRLVRLTEQPSDAEIEAAFASGGQQSVQELFEQEARDETFRIRAVSAQSSTSFSASNGLFISVNKARELSEFLTADTDQYQKYVSAVVKVKEGEDPKVTADYLNGRQMAARTAKDLQGLIFTIVGILQGIVAGFGALALIASVFGIINTQYISVLERTSQIGLMKALGMPRKGVAKLFRYEAAWIGLIGGLIGSLTAFILGLLLNPFITETLELGDNTILIFVWWQIALLLLGLIAVAIVAGWLPARKAAKLDPIEALRTE